MNSRHTKKEPPWATTATMEFETEGAEPLESRGSEAKPEVEGVIDAQQVPLLGLDRFAQWLEHATPQEAAAAEQYCEKDLRNCYGHGRKWRLTTGAALYRHREIFKKLGRHDWIEWVEKELGLRYPTAWSYMNELKRAREAGGLSSPNVDDEPARPSLEVGEPSNTVTAEELLNGEHNANLSSALSKRPTHPNCPLPRESAVELDLHATMVVKLHMDRDVYDRGVVLRKERDRRDRLYRRLHESYMQWLHEEEQETVEAIGGEQFLEVVAASSASLVPQPEPAPATA